MRPTVVVVAAPGERALLAPLTADERFDWHMASGADAAAVLDKLLRPVAVASSVGVLGVATAGEAAVLAAAQHGEVAALVLWAAPLGPAAVELLAEWPELAVLAAADPADRPGLAGAVDAYLASAHAASDLLVGPLDPGAIRTWLVGRLAGQAPDEVVLNSTDGWELHGTRWLPERAEPVPGVVLLHSGRSDRAAFARVERLLAEAGLAVLNLDWRGRGQSTNRGTYFDLTSEERDTAWRDAGAALEHLAGQAEVDGSRLAAVGVVHGAEHAARAAWRDPRVKALALLTGYQPTEPEEAPHLTSGTIDVLYVTSTDHTITSQAMRALHEATPPGRSQYLEYPGAAIGYQLFDQDPELEPRIVAWLAEVLGR